ncbi:cytochrome c-type biogenesis CcmF C-terminal domain-containing protein [Psychrobacter sp. VH5]
MPSSAPLYPIIADAFSLGQVSVGPPYFNALFVPY